MTGFYLVMCLQLVVLTWVPSSNLIHRDRLACERELRHTAGVCRCTGYIVVLEQRGDE